MPLPSLVSWNVCLAAAVGGQEVGSIGALAVAAFDSDSGADDRDEVGCVDGPPLPLGRLGELEHHSQGACAGADPRVTRVRRRTGASVD
jgi:hypothetical protein